MRKNNTESFFRLYPVLAAEFETAPLPKLIHSGQEFNRQLPSFLKLKKLQKINFRRQNLTSSTIRYITIVSAIWPQNLPHCDQHEHIDFKSKVNENEMIKNKVRRQMHSITSVTRSIKQQLYTIYKMPVDIY